MDEDQVTWTTIYRPQMIKYNLTANEYMLIDIIARMGKRTGYCYATRQWLSDQLNMTKQGLMLLVNRLIERELLKKNDMNKLIAPDLWLDEVDGIKRKGSKQSLQSGKQKISSGKESFTVGQNSLPNIESIQLEEHKDTLSDKSKGEWNQVKEYYEKKLKSLIDDPYIDWRMFTKMVNPIFKQWNKDKTIKALEGFFADDWIQNAGYPLGAFKKDPNRYLGISKYDPKVGLGVDEYLERESKLVKEAEARATSEGLPEELREDVQGVR